ncbi:MAG: hypothetical protein A2103_04210 [Gammaproteobacteria bacterium GWF2_41_13]|nr:MAG: hypothetical protein A2103_04210 [Gammaproteobacteria bacterium GWF2_41_13]
MTPMIIFISQKTIMDRHGVELDALETTYINFFENENIFPKGAVFIPVPNNPEITAHIAHTLMPNMIILTGGNNVDPKLFGSDAALGDLAHNRDITEKSLFDYAVSNAVPVLGICRGFHFINVLLKGKLTLNINDHLPAAQHACLYEGKRYIVNSFHNHAIHSEDLAAELSPIVVAEMTDIVEAYSGRILSKVGMSSVLGVQWHPERPGGDIDLFKKLVKQFLFEEGQP